MGFLTIEFWTTLLLIVSLDLVLAGDNAIVIAMAAKRLPKKQQKKAILWGTVGAVLIRAVATVLVVWLLKVPGLHLIGGLLLVWISYKRMFKKSPNDKLRISTLARFSGPHVVTTYIPVLKTSPP